MVIYGHIWPYMAIYAHIWPAYAYAFSYDLMIYLKFIFSSMCATGRAAARVGRRNVAHIDEKIRMEHNAPLDPFFQDTIQSGRGHQDDGQKSSKILGHFLPVDGQFWS